MTREKPKNLWLSRWGFILAATGSAVGLGNIWKFPYITGEFGGGAFVLMYLLCILAIGVPVMMCEIAIGRRGRGSPIDAIGRVVRENNGNPLWKAVGGMAMAWTSCPRSTCTTSRFPSPRLRARARRR